VPKHHENLKAEEKLIAKRS